MFLARRSLLQSAAALLVPLKSVFPRPAQLLELEHALER